MDANAGLQGLIRAIYDNLSYLWQYGGWSPEKARFTKYLFDVDLYFDIKGKYRMSWIRIR